MRINRATCALLLFSATIWTLATPHSCSAGDWPMWRNNAARSSASPDDLPETLHLQWMRKLPLARPAWPASQTKLQFDVSYEPVVLGRRMFVGSNVNDSVTAYDTRSGEELWRFYTDGPVRFAPAAANGRVYACSDDGHLYCLNAETGKQLWKVNGGPAVRPIIGNKRLVSSWPARGGVVLADGNAYFAASIWPSPPAPGLAAALSGAAGFAASVFCSSGGARPATTAVRSLAMRTMSKVGGFSAGGTAFF